MQQIHIPWYLGCVLYWSLVVRRSIIGESLGTTMQMTVKTHEFANAGHQAGIFPSLCPSVFWTIFNLVLRNAPISASSADNKNAPAKEAVYSLM